MNEPPDAGRHVQVGRHADPLVQLRGVNAKGRSPYTKCELGVARLELPLDMTQRYWPQKLSALII